MIRFRLPCLLLPVAALATMPNVRASLLVYEGFNGYTIGKLEGQIPNANTTGLDTISTKGYYDGATTSRAGTFTAQASGLTFGTLATSGGSMGFTTGTNVIGADIEIGSTAYTGTLWNSYLITFTAKGTAQTGGEGAVLRVSAAPNDNTNSRFNSWADSRSGTSNTQAVGYAATGVDGSGTLALNTTYIIIGKFTNVGVTLSPSVQGVATQWALTESQFAAFLAAGGDEAALGSVTITGMSTQTVSSGTTNIFSSASAFAFVSVNDSGTFDELRYASTLAEVVPTNIPEPSSAAALAALAIGGAALLRRRRGI